MSQIRIPSGTRDLIGEEVRIKRELEAALMNLFSMCGYEEIMTPALEYHQTYSTSFAALEEREMYKFVDENGDILALRMDMTAPIARVATSKFKEAQKPLRFSYASNVYKVREKFGGRRSEVEDCGIELIGSHSLMADVEVLKLALQAMELLGFEDYVLEIGSSSFFWHAATHYLSDRKDQEKLADLIDRKSMVELEEFLDSLNLSPAASVLFLSMPMLAGGPVVLYEAAKLLDPSLESVRDDLISLAELFDALERLGLGEHISFDLGKIPHKDYYTGIIFEGFASGVGTSVLSGGRYDHLLAKFGQDLPACGFSIKIDYLLDAVGSLEIEDQEMVLLAPESLMVEAFLKADQLRRQGLIVSVNQDDSLDKVVGVMK